jgi:hypothetical protein
MNWGKELIVPKGESPLRVTFFKFKYFLTQTEYQLRKSTFIPVKY